MRTPWPSILTFFFTPGLVVAVPLARDKPTMRNVPHALFRITLSKAEEVKSFRQYQISLLKGKTFHDAMLLHPEIACLKSLSGQLKGSAWLQENLKVAFMANGDLMISFNGGSQVEQVTIINSVVQDYLEVVEYRTAAARKTRPMRTKYWEKTILHLEGRRLKEIHDRIQTYQQRLKQTTDPAKMRSYASIIEGCQKTLKRITKEIQRSKEKLQKIRLESDESPVTLLKKAELPKAK